MGSIAILVQSPLEQVCAAVCTASCTPSPAKPMPASGDCCLRGRILPQTGMHRKMVNLACCSSHPLRAAGTQHSTPLCNHPVSLGNQMCCLRAGSRASVHSLPPPHSPQLSPVLLDGPACPLGNPLCCLPPSSGASASLSRRELSVVKCEPSALGRALSRLARLLISRWTSITASFLRSKTPSMSVELRMRADPSSENAVGTSAQRAVLSQATPGGARAQLLVGRDSAARLALMRLVSQSCLSCSTHARTHARTRTRAHAHAHAHAHAYAHAGKKSGLTAEEEVPIAQCENDAEIGHGQRGCCSRKAQRVGHAYLAAIARQPCTAAAAAQVCSA